jgi:hypothetical protein
VLVRFGRWEEILELKLPTDHDKYCVTTATIHYHWGAFDGQQIRINDLFELFCSRHRVYESAGHHSGARASALWSLGRDP